MQLFKTGRVVFTREMCTIIVLLCACFADAQTKNIKINPLHYFSLPSTVKYNPNHRYYVMKRTPLVAADFVRSIDDSIVITEVNNERDYEVLIAKNTLLLANNQWKLSPSFQVANNKNIWRDRYIVSAKNIDALLLKLKEKKVEILTVDHESNSVVVKCSPSFLRDEIQPINEVHFIDKLAIAHAETNIIGYDRSFHGINAVDYLLPGANGKSIVAGVKEQRVEDGDIDLWKRVLLSPAAGSIVTNHATVIASIIAGAGNSFYDGRGIAWGATIFPSSFANLFADDANLLSANNVSVQNHSYGTIIQQFYGAEALSYDLLAWKNKNYVAVMSAGNQGTAAAPEGRYANISGFANLTGNFKMAKNVITVAAIDNKEVIAEQSSSGPLYDGRLAPQITALGPNGTSDASAIVSGTVAVMQQVYADSNNKRLPPASLIKAVLYNTSNDIYNEGIDYKTGFGLLNSFDAVKAIQQKKYDGGTINQGQQWSKLINVPANAATLKVTLSWTDSSSTINNNRALMNDLDMVVKNVFSNDVFKPWVLSTVASKDSLSSLPIRKRDSLNTAEQVSINFPVPGDYEISVNGFSITSTDLAFSIAMNIDTLNTFSFTSPLHASDVNRQENESAAIRWKTFVRDTNTTGNLYISYDNSTTWQPVQSAIRLKDQKYNWAIPDTNSLATFKMETPFGEFTSKTIFIGRLTIPYIDFNCTDSFRMSWNKHRYADSYNIFTLTDSPYLKKVATVSDTFIVYRKANLTSPVFAIEPVLNNGVAAARSVAINVEAQGVQCFYKTLNYDLLDFNKLKLTLELSAPGYVDSVYFERVTANGEVVETYGGSKVNALVDIYNYVVENVLPGTTYLRGKIIMKNGGPMYTNIVSVLTTGSKYIRFYPNPAKRTLPLQRSILQGVATDTRLQFFDSYGRLVKNFTSLPDKINITGFPKGLVFYRLIGDDNKTLETGKIIVQ